MWFSLLRSLPVLHVLIQTVLTGDEKFNDGICEEGASISRHCQVMVGSLSIENEAFDGESFQNLREITGYLEVRNVKDLIALSEMFPKLTVIRGETLKQNFLLIITDNPDLDRVGLHNLNNIGNGKVKIQNNPKLCFAKSVNWSLIAPEALLESDVIEETLADCSTCVGYEFCWNLITSQKVCSPPCLNESCIDGACCDSECLGGCSEDNHSKCNACRNYSFKGFCTKTCPTGTLIYLDRFCVTIDDCRRGDEHLNSTSRTPTHVSFNNTCSRQCPVGYSKHTHEKHFIATCELDGAVKQYCSDIKIRNVDDLNSYIGKSSCQVINGFVDIQFNTKLNSNESHLNDEEFTNRISKISIIFKKEIIEIFAKVERIRDYLKISHSPFLQDLSLFPKLETIEGDLLVDEKYSLVLDQNENLRNMWNQDQNVTIIRGETFIDDSMKYLIAPKQPNNTIIVQIKTVLHFVMISWKLPNAFNEMKSKCFLYTLSNNRFEDFDRHSCTKIITKRFTPQDASNRLFLFLPDFKRSLAKQYYFELQLLSSENKTVASSSTKHFELNHSLTNISLTALSTSLGHSETASNVHELKWNRTYFEKYDFDRYEVSAFHVPYDMTSDLTSYCESSQRKFLDADYDKYGYIKGKLGSYQENFELMDVVSKELFMKELWNEPYHQSNKVFQKKAHRLADSCFLRDLKSFEHYYVIIKACLGSGWCSDPQLEMFMTEKRQGLNKVVVTVTTDKPKAMDVSWRALGHTNGPIMYIQVDLILEGLQTVREQCVDYRNSKPNENLNFVNLETGNYLVNVTVATLGERSKPTSTQAYVDAINIKQDSTLDFFNWTLIFSAAFVALLILIGLLVFCATRKNPLNVVQSFDLTILHKESEMKREDLELILELGNGNFGVVYRGKLRTFDGNTEVFIDVAVKSTNDRSTLEDCDMLLEEANIMKSFNTKHIVKLLGIISDDEKHFIVMELMTNQDLKTFLIKNQPLSRDNASSGYELLVALKRLPAAAQIAIQIADGMAYLANKRFVHRDLAARNCMVAEDQTVKIGDFGMARDIYCSDYYRMERQRQVPVRWMAPESLKDRIFTTKSDVFSYGIVLWEIATFAEQPYKSIPIEDVIDHIIEGGTERRPEQNCSDEFYDLMTKCWKLDPNERITFIEIIEELLDEAPESFSEGSFYSLRNDV